MVELSEHEFGQFRSMLYRIAGINLTPAKRSLVSSRLLRRVTHFQFSNFKDYYELITSDEHRGELQTAIDLLTTNETHFFRENRHLDYLQQVILPQIVRPALRIWSAACSTGEEPYSIAMLLATHCRNKSWDITATDISSRVLEKARRGRYPLEQSREIPPPLLQEYCLRGVGQEDGYFIIQREIARRIQFLQLNLNQSLPELGEFDVIFLRNILIYFDLPTKQAVLGRIIRQLKPGGYLFIGHSESLNGVTDEVHFVAPAIFCKP